MTLCLCWILYKLNFTDLYNHYYPENTDQEKSDINTIKNDLTCFQRGYYCFSTGAGIVNF